MVRRIWMEIGSSRVWERVGVDLGLSGGVSGDQIVSSGDRAWAQVRPMVYALAVLGGVLCAVDERQRAFAIAGVWVVLALPAFATEVWGMLESRKVQRLLGMVMLLHLLFVYLFMPALLEEQYWLAGAAGMLELALLIPLETWLVVRAVRRAGELALA